MHTRRRGPARLRYRRKERPTNDHDVERDRHEALGPVRLRVRRDVVNQEACPNEERDLKQIYNIFRQEKKGLNAKVRRHSPKSNDRGLSSHQPSSVTSDVQNSRTCMLKLIARPSAMEFGGDGAAENCCKLERTKNAMARVPSAGY